MLNSNENKLSDKDWTIEVDLAIDSVVSPNFLSVENVKEEGAKNCYLGG